MSRFGRGYLQVIRSTETEVDRFCYTVCEMDIPYCFKWVNLHLRQLKKFSATALLWGSPLRDMLWRMPYVSSHSW